MGKSKFEQPCQRKLVFLLTLYTPVVLLLLFLPNVVNGNCEWGQWQTCNATCGGGVKPRYRNESCTGSTTQLMCCNAENCKLDCNLTTWLKWGECTVPCGNGTRSRIKRVIQEPMNGGNSCGVVEQTEACNVHACPQDCCALTEWSAWSLCTASCIAGIRVRSRTVGLVTTVRSGTTNNSTCPPDKQKEVCNVVPCGRPCQLGDWGNWMGCSVSCGQGSMSRLRPVITPASGGMMMCSQVVDNKPCAGNPCPMMMMMGGD